MSDEPLIDQILTCQPEPLERLGELRWHPLIAQFGYYYMGVAERWYWFDKRNPDQHPTAERGHRFLQDASPDELAELLGLLDAAERMGRAGG